MTDNQIRALAEQYVAQHGQYPAGDPAHRADEIEAEIRAELRRREIATFIDMTYLPSGIQENKNDHQ